MWAVPRVRVAARWGPPGELLRNQLAVKMASSDPAYAASRSPTGSGWSPPLSTTWLLWQVP